MAPRQLKQWYFSGPQHPYVSGQALMLPLPSTFTTPEICKTEFPNDETLVLDIDGDEIHLPKPALERTRSLIRDAGLSEEGRTRGMVKMANVTEALADKLTSREAFDVVFGCLLYGFIDINTIRCDSSGMMQQYLDVGKDGQDDRAPTAATDLDHLIDSIILADALQAPSVVSLLVRELRAEFDSTIPSVDQLRRMMTVEWATGTFLKYWIFAWDDEGKKSRSAVELHANRVEEAIKEAEELAEFSKQVLRACEVAKESEQVVRKALGMLVDDERMAEEPNQWDARGSTAAGVVAKANPRKRLRRMDQARILATTNKVAKTSSKQSSEAANTSIKDVSSSADRKTQQRAAIEGTRVWAEGRRREVKPPQGLRARSHDGINGQTS